MKILRVGDPHVRPSNLEESEHLMDYVRKLAMEHAVDRIELLGDLFHTHAILRVEVIDFWTRWLSTFALICPQVIVLVGNHDQSGSHDKPLNALSIFGRIPWDNVTIVDTIANFGPIGYMAYVHERYEFIARAEELAKQGCKILVCHATFDGSKYENGFFAPDGMPMLPQFTHVISGHIHAQQEFGNVIYPGTARWDTISDANQPKGLWIYEHEKDGQITKRDFFTTEHVCSPIFFYQWKEGEDAPVIPTGCRATLEVVGTSEFCAKAKGLYKGQASFKSKILDGAKREQRKSGRSLEEFLISHYIISAERRLKLLKFMRENKLV